MDDKYLQPFIDSTKEILEMMAQVQVFSTSVTPIQTSDMNSYGLASVLTFSGASVSGRLILDFPQDVALRIASNLLGEEKTDIRDKMVLAAISEINNTVAGNANTVLNNEFGFGLRLAPPIVVAGEKAIFSSVKLKSVSVMCKANIGFFRFYLALKGVE